MPVTAASVSVTSFEPCLVDYVGSVLMVSAPPLTSKIILPLLVYSPGSALYLAVGLSPHELLNEFFLMIIGLGTDL